MLKSVQVMVGQNGNQNGHHSKLSNFQQTKPPSFSHTTDPLDADDWLRTIERKLEIARTEEGYKVPFAMHYLEGAAAIWWDNAKTIWPADDEITWAKFKEHFRKYHIPIRVMNIKQHEFLALTQGIMTVNEYLNKFNHLARYSLHDVATEEWKIDRFLGGLNQHLSACRRLPHSATRLDPITLDRSLALADTGAAGSKHGRVASKMPQCARALVLIPNRLLCASARVGKFLR
ncbi:uncharacterized protein [Aegilops tauschii subsp. strangulata]|uniref:uncharacterized protein n=1 Tax=Aegilops tauschii subsp. strangulata TaxID=200361 RepID=UPI003CC89562